MWIVLALQAEFWKFEKGTTWTYEHAAGEEKRRVVVTLEGVNDEGASLATKIYKEGAAEPEGHVSSIEPMDGGFAWTGVYWTGGPVGDFVETLLLKPDAKKDETWKPSTRKPWTATHRGSVEVKVPAGTYKEARLIDLACGDIKVRTWFVPKVGLVRIEREDGFVSELKEFTPGKDE